MSFINKMIEASGIYALAYDGLTYFRWCPWCGKKLTETNPVSLDFMRGETEG